MTTITTWRDLSSFSEGVADPSCEVTLTENNFQVKVEFQCVSYVFAFVYVFVFAADPS